MKWWENKEIYRFSFRSKLEKYQSWPILILPKIIAVIWSIVDFVWFSYRYPNHEKLIAEIARNIGFENISLSSEVMPMLKIVPRGFTSIFSFFLQSYRFKLNYNVVILCIYTIFLFYLRVILFFYFILLFFSLNLHTLALARIL